MKQKSSLGLPEDYWHESTWFAHLCSVLGVDNAPAWPDQFGDAFQRWFMASQHTPIKTLSLFSGGGGLDIAFRDMGFDCIEMVEINKQYVATLELNAQVGGRLAGSTPMCVDISHYDPPHEPIDFIIGGPPCQPFSSAGRRAAGVSGTADPRGLLFEDYVRLLKQIKPKGFLFENVYGIVSAQQGTVWQAIKDAFRAAGYAIFYRILDSADYGVPQHRERLFIIGLRVGSFKFPFPTHGPDSLGQQAFYIPSQAVDGADIAGVDYGLGGQFGHLLDDIPPGLNYSFYTEKLGHPNPVFGWRSKFSDFLYKASPDFPLRTIIAHGGQYTGPFSWENRHFSIGELKRLQTIPDNYAMAGNRWTAIEQIGNAVPPQMARILALAVLDQVFDVALPFDMYYMPDDFQLGFRKRKRQMSHFYQMQAQQAIQKLDHQGKILDWDDFQECRVYPRYLTPDFQWTTDDQPHAEEFLIESNLNRNAWSLFIHHKTSALHPPFYEIEITPVEDDAWNLPTQRVCLSTNAHDPIVFTALWKAFEEKLSSVTHRADLVQLCGYFQFPSRIATCFTFKTQTSLEPSQAMLWATVQKIGSGLGVGQQMSQAEYGRLFEVNAEAILPLFEHLKLLGYEIRNQHTNPQIPPCDFLIPYAFPTLNYHSVQRRKSLRG